MVMSTNVDSAAAASVSPMQRPMTIAVTKLAGRFCQDDCPAWIAAEGRIVPETPTALKRVLASLGKNRLPIFVTSPGGDVEAAMKMGEMIRKLHLAVAVGTTYFESCKDGTKRCQKSTREHPFPEGFVLSSGVPCVSACTLVLAGGERRYGGGYSFIGVHQVSYSYNKQRVYWRERYVIKNGRKIVINRTVTKTVNVGKVVTTKVPKVFNTRLTAYLTKMGIDLKLLDLMAQTPPSDIHIMTPRELKDLKMTTTSDSGLTLVTAATCKAMPKPGHCLPQRNGSQTH
jgi:hypothetical protein